MGSEMCIRDRDTDSCRHLASHHEPSTSSSPRLQQQQQQQPSLSCVDHHRPATSKAPSQRYLTVDSCCTLHCRRQLMHGAQRLRTAISRRLERDVADIHRYLRVYLGRLNDAEHQNRVARDWRLVARLLDRLFFFMYVSTVAVSLATIFPKG